MLRASFRVPGACGMAGRRRSWLIRLAMLSLVLWMPLALWAPAASAAQVTWPSLSLSGLLSWLAGPPPSPKVPVQESGSAAGRAHYVPASVTRAVARAAGRAPGRGPGQLPRYAPHGRSARRFDTGPYVGDGSHSFSATTSRLLPGGSTATSDLYRNADGSYTRLVYLGPVNYQSSSGAWRPINTSLAAGPGGRWQETANSLRVSLAARAGDAALGTLDLGAGRRVSLALGGAAQVPGVLAGSSVRYARALPGTDAAISATPSGLRFSLALRSASARAGWLLPLRLIGLTAELG